MKLAHPHPGPPPEGEGVSWFVGIEPTNQKEHKS